MSDDRCPYGLCDGTGWLVDEETNTASPCRCRPERIARRSVRKLSAVIPKRYRGASFDRPPISEIPESHLRPVRAFVRDIDRALDEGRGLWLYGGVGTGKTTLAMLVSRTALEAGRSVAIYSVPRLLGELRATYDQSSNTTATELMDELARVDLLHLDDLGTEMTTPWVLEQLYSIVNARYEEQRSIIVTSNEHDADKLREQVTDRVVSRLTEMCEQIPVFGRDLRVVM